MWESLWMSSRETYELINSYHNISSSNILQSCSQCMFLYLKKYRLHIILNLKLTFLTDCESKFRAAIANVVKHKWKSKCENWDKCEQKLSVKFDRCQSWFYFRFNVLAEFWKSCHLYYWNVDVLALNSLKSMNTQHSQHDMFAYFVILLVCI